MDVSCPSCSARYVADDEKLRGKTARMRCKACSTVWMVTGAPADAAPKSVAAPKRAAVVKKGSEREQRDLFAMQEPELGSIKQTPAPSFSGTGARSEHSVLFRVDQLTSAARVKTPPPERAADLKDLRADRGAEPRQERVSRSDDEGVIDLKALASAPRPVAAPLAPLFSEPPPVALDIDGKAPALIAQSRKRLFVSIGAAAAFLVVSVMGLSYVFKSEEPVARTMAPAAPVEITPPPAEIAPPAASVAAAEASPAPETDAPKPSKGKRGKGGKGRGMASTATAAKSSFTPKPVKAANPCGCNGDFNCILACTAKRR